MVQDVKKGVAEAIVTLKVNITKDVKSEDALRYTQAMLNAAHVIQVMSIVENNG